MMASRQEELQKNALLRQALLATGIRQTKSLGTFTESSSPQGKTTRIKLFNVGVITGLTLKVTANVTIGTAVGTASPKSPWNAIKQIKVTDFNGIDRVSCTGFQLWLLNCARKRTPAFYNNEGLSSVSSLPAVPLSVATADVEFYVEVPFAYDAERDLRGAILAQSNYGEMFLNITWNDDFHRNGDDDGVYNGGATSTVAVNSISVEVGQQFLMPQSVDGQIPLPMLDLMTIYEIVGNIQVSDNLANGAERLIPYPNVRSVLASYFTWQNNSAMANTISKFTLKANGNNILQERSLHEQQMYQRNIFNGDLRSGVFMFDHRTKPIETAMYGQVQAGLTLSAAPTGTYYINQMFESMYAQGSTLPGIGQE